MLPLNRLDSYVVLALVIGQIEDKGCVECIADVWKFRPESSEQYLFSSLILQWADAFEYCQDRQSDLLVIHSDHEEEWLETWLKQESSSLTWWIGLTHNKREALWKWIDGSLLDTNISNWQQLEPDDGVVENICVRYVKGSKKLKDGNCKERNCFACYSGPDALRSLPVPFTFTSLELYNERMEWRKAYTTCRERGWSLVTISSWLAKGVMDYYILYDESDCDTWWLGNKGVEATTEWTWVEYDEQLDESTMPSIAEECAGIQNGFLSDHACSERLPFICKRRMNSGISLDIWSIQMGYNYLIVLPILAVILILLAAMATGLLDTFNKARGLDSGKERKMSYA